MSPPAYMLLGFATGVMAVVASVFHRDVTSFAFTAGALFGKGYGVWEERR